MPGREIPRDEWVAFFDSFSRQHYGWLSTVEVREAEIGAQIKWLEKALMGITADLTEQDGDVISILVGGKSDDHVAHIIRAPSHVRLKETQEGAHEALHIEAENGATTLLRFRSPILSELVDGIVLDR